MKAYVVTTGSAFGLIVLAHVARVVVEGPALAKDPSFVLLTAAAAGLSLWAYPSRWRSWVEYQQALFGAAHPALLAAGRESLRIQLGRPRQPEFSSEGETEANRLDLLASREQFLQDGRAQRRSSLQQIPRFLKWLLNANVAQQFEDGALRLRHEGAVGLFLKARDSEQRSGLLIEQAETSVVAGEGVREPRGQWSGCPPVQAQLRTLGDVVPDTVPVEC